MRLQREQALLRAQFEQEQHGKHAKATEAVGGRGVCAPAWRRGRKRGGEGARGGWQLWPAQLPAHALRSHFTTAAEAKPSICGLCWQARGAAGHHPGNTSCPPPTPFQGSHPAPNCFALQASGAQSLESDGVVIKFKPPPPGRQRRPSQQPVPLAGARGGGSPGVEIRFKPPPPPREVEAEPLQGHRAQDVDPTGRANSGAGVPSAEPAAAAVPSGGSYPHIAASGALEATSPLDPPERSSSTAAVGHSRGAIVGPGFAAEPPAPLSRGGSFGLPALPASVAPGGSRLGTAAGARGSQGLEERFEVAAREDSLRAALAVQVGGLGGWGGVDVCVCVCSLVGAWLAVVGRGRGGGWQQEFWQQA